MPNINITVPDELHKKMKLTALMKDQTLQDFFITTLERRVRKRTSNAEKKPAQKKPHKSA